MSLILSGTDGLSDVDGSAATPAIRGTDANTGIFFPAADTIAFSEGGAEAMRIDSSGNVGIGTSSPTGKLHVSAPINTQYGTFDAVTDTYAFTTYKVGGTSYGQIGDASGLVSGGTAGNLAVRFSGAMVFSGGANERMRIDSSGNLLVGRTTQTSSEKVCFEYSSSVGPGLTVNNSFSGGGTAIQFCTLGSGVGNITTGFTTTSYNTSSDYRLKNTIAPMTGALAKVALLKPVTYKWNIDGSSSQGFIAHELQEVVPDCVNGEKDAVETYTDEDGNEQTRPKYQGIDTGFLVATLTAAIQEQQALITTLTARITALETP
jgi:hypothetical protein